MRVQVLFVSLLLMGVAYADPHVAKVTSVSTGSCGTDGGPVKCSTGVQYLGELVRMWWNDHTSEDTLVCATDVKPGTYTVKVGFDYNNGDYSVRDGDKTQAKWPGCVKDFAKQGSEKLLAWWHMLQPIDASIDVNAVYKITIAIKK
jgi:hypothetical protein